MMRSSCSLLAVLLAFSAPTLATYSIARAAGLDLIADHSASLNVSPTGDDKGDGSAGKPLATLDRAVAYAREKSIKQIILHGGQYYDTGVELTGADSGLTIEAGANEAVTLIGGVKLSGWQKDDKNDKFYAAKLPDGPNWDIRMLQVNGRMAPNARFPETGVFQSLNQFNVKWMSSTGGGWQRKPTPEEFSSIKYNENDIPGDIEVKNAEVTLYHSWDESSVGITKQDAETHAFTIFPLPTYPSGAFHHHEYFLSNVREGMTKAGQWYFDRVNGRIVYWPVEGEDMAKAEVLVPTHYNIIAIKGTREEAVKNITLKNFKLEIATVPLTSAGMGGEKYPGAINITSGEDITLDGLTISQVAGHAIHTTNQGCRNVTVSNCTVTDCGCGGIYVGGTQAVIKNNLVQGCGRIYSGGMGIHGNGVDCLLSHNEVSDIPYSAIDYRGTGVMVEYNKLSDYMKVLHDGGAIYMFASKNCTMRGNVARGTPTNDDMDALNMGYYLDERCEDCTVEGNLCVNVPWGLHMHMSKNNTIRNNTIVSEGDMRLTFESSHHLTIENNVFYAVGNLEIKTTDDHTWKNDIAFSQTGNVKMDMSAKKPAAGEAAEPSAENPDELTQAVDPGFVDAASGDYRFKPDGAAAKLGIPSIDPSKAGREVAATQK